jgi:hypothetical protein
MRIPQIQTLILMPPRERGPCLRALLERHRDALAGLDLNQHNARRAQSRYIMAIAKIEHMARVLGIESLASP